MPERSIGRGCKPRAFGLRGFESLPAHNNDMKNLDFYGSVKYKDRQSEITKNNWQKGTYDFFRNREKKQCIHPDCANWFEVGPANPKKFCSRKCAAQINNPKRSKIDSSAEEKLRNLYQKGFSVEEISTKTSWKHGKVAYWMKKFNIPRRSISDAVYIKCNPNGDPFKIKNKLGRNEILLKGLGLGLYLGEGDKSKNNTSVRLSNTDPQIIKIFREFLLKICNIKKKLGYSLVLFNDCDEKKTVKFWGKHLGIKKSWLGKITKIPPQGKGTYRKKSEFGVLTITITNKKLKNEIFRMTDELFCPNSSGSRA